MPKYRLRVFEPSEKYNPEEYLRHKRCFEAADDKQAIEEARKRFAGFASLLPPDFPPLDRFVLYEGERVVYEHVGPKN